MANERQARNHKDDTPAVLGEEELRYRTVADFTYDWEYWQAPDGSLRYVSPSCERITGHRAEEFLSKPHLLDEIVLRDDSEVWAEHQQHVALQQAGEIEFRIRRRDGQVRWIEHVCQPVTDEQGTFLGYRVSNRDATARKQTEAELQRYREQLEELVAERTAELEKANMALKLEIAVRQQAEVAQQEALAEAWQATDALHRSEERYALAQRAAHIGSWDWNILTGDLHWSDQIEPLFGFGRGQFGATYEAFLDCVHPEDRQRVVDAVDASVEHAADYQIEHRIVWPDGTVRWVMETGDVMRDGNGKPVRMLGIVQDITERKRAEETRARLASIVQSSEDAIIGKALDGTILTWNHGAERIYGYPASEAVGKPISILFPPDRLEEIAHILDRVKGGGRVSQFETVRVAKDGRELYVSLNISPILDDAGQVVGASTIARDITEGKLAEQALRRAKDQEEARRLEAERRRSIAESLSDVLKFLNSNRTLKEVLNYIAAQAGQLLGTRAAGIYTLERETGTWSVQATRGLLVTYIAGARIPVGQSALHRAMTSRHPVSVSDLAVSLETGEEQLPGVDQRTAAASWARIYRALLAVPIVVQDQVYGGMLLYYGQPRSFSEEEVDLAVAFGDQVALAIGNDQLRQQVEQAATSAERDRLARELHDAVTQTLFSASLIAEAMPRVWEQNPEEGRRGLEELRRLTRGAAAEMRTMLVELRPAALTEKPLGELLRHLTEAMSGRTRVPVELKVDGDSVLPPDIQIALYRITQEALNNISKHAGASTVTVALACQSDRTVLQVSDNGSGFEPRDVLPDRFGLGIMRERAQDIGAAILIDSQPGQGTRISVTCLN